MSACVDYIGDSHVMLNRLEMRERERERDRKCVYVCMGKEKERGEREAVLALRGLPETAAASSSGTNDPPTLPALLCRGRALPCPRGFERAPGARGSDAQWESGNENVKK